MKLDMDYGQRRLINVVAKIPGAGRADGSWSARTGTWTFGASDSTATSR